MNGTFVEIVNSLENGEAFIYQVLCRGAQDITELVNIDILECQVFHFLAFYPLEDFFQDAFANEFHQFYGQENRCDWK